MTPNDQAAVLVANLPRLYNDLDQGAIVVIQRSRLRLRRLPVLPPIPEQWSADRAGPHQPAAA